MNSICTIENKTQTLDEFGQASDVYATIAADVPCRVQPINAGYRRTAHFEAADATHVLYLPIGAYTIDEFFRIVVTDDQNYIVKFAKKDSQRDHWELDCVAENKLQ